MDKRPLESVIEMNFKKIEGTLKNLGCKSETIEYILNEQKEYISELQKKLYPSFWIKNIDYGAKIIE